jgi:hypothetical protein
LAVETNVNDGIATSSPGPTPSSSAASSRAWVHEVVRSTGAPPWISSSSSRQRRVKPPSPAIQPLSAASAT